MTPGRTRFLQRRSYRRRRIADAARLLPVAGAILLMLPLLRLGQGNADDPARTSQVGIYIFVVWVCLMAVAAGLSRGLRDAKNTGPDIDPPPDVEGPDA